jgi:gas vesicle protein
MDEKIIVVKQSGFGIFLRGAIIGAGLALLLAPRSGRETRELLNEKGSEIKDKAYDIALDTRSRAQSVIHDARSMIAGKNKNIKDSMNDTVEDLKRDVAIMEDINNPIYPL